MGVPRFIVRDWFALHHGPGDFVHLTREICVSLRHGIPVCKSQRGALPIFDWFMGVGSYANVCPDCAALQPDVAAALRLQGGQQ